MRLLLCVLGALALLSGSAAAEIRSSIPAWGLVTYFYDVGTVPGLDYDAVISDQPIDLTGTWFGAFGNSMELCYEVPALQNGLTYTLVSTTGGLSGRLVDNFGATLEDGAVLRNVGTIGRGCMHSLGSLELHYHESGPVQTVTATVVDGSPIPVTTTHVAVPSGSVETNQPVTLTATVRPSSGGVAGGVSFSDEAAWERGPLCADVPVTLVDGTWTATCKAALRAPPEPGAFMWSGNIWAGFAPADAEALVGSATTAWLTVRPGRTSTSLRIDHTAAGHTLATATVVPAYSGPNVPTGTVRFAEAGTPIAGCEAQPLTGSEPAQATCDLGVPAVGGHALDASYAGDDAFEGSQSTPAAFTSESSATLPPPSAAPPASSEAQPAASHRRGTGRRRHCRRRHRRHADARPGRSQQRCRLHAHRRRSRRVLTGAATAPAA